MWFWGSFFRSEAAACGGLDCLKTAAFSFCLLNKVVCCANKLEGAEGRLADINTAFPSRGIYSELKKSVRQAQGMIDKLIGQLLQVTKGL